MTGTVLFMPSQENPELPINYHSQPPFMRISKFDLHAMSLTFSDLIVNNQNGEIDGKEMVVYDPTIPGSTPKKYVQDQIIYTDGLLKSSYSSRQKGHDDLSDLGDTRIWEAFKDILTFSRIGHFGKTLVTRKCQEDLDVLCSYLVVTEDFKKRIDWVCMGELDSDTDMVG
jgi:hypothetical protein